MSDTSEIAVLKSLFIKAPNSVGIQEAKCNPCNCVPLPDLSKCSLCPKANFQAPLCPFVLLYLRDEIRS